ncbi:hypothetical protein CAL7102_09468 [Dulcicalothrix desertica PCC 7102]|nr:hypothetical protein CAL7102_09468 [Dulcicalothrix desertica PCC 7102]
MFVVEWASLPVPTLDGWIAANNANSSKGKFPGSTLIIERMSSTSPWSLARFLIYRKRSVRLSTDVVTSDSF